ncbi:D-amino-acid transaminase [Polymorphobacter multimanifer]|uniref:Probable branched-chain-amino-acid aminotransferase n=1 Tax=Polymorphobacter multimanifer TaxID=1070431 RepID=A0A841L2K8_9SPHN|nr:D-amino-acid transaminase [Polymorphobacter multimanifer]MBB6226546.1 D-alanine transaminase [Polymorphobacter multimanifer]GGI93839.1 D-amino-acid transaminase [Polymorphobacter multimanifer]
MPQLAYVDGQYLPMAEAMVPVEDRGLQFADSIYEVAAIFDGRLLDWPEHLVRMRRNCAALFISLPQSDAVLSHIARRLIAMARVRDAIIYIQVTRGTARRDHVFAPGLRPRLIMTVRRFDFRQRIPQQAKGVGVTTVPDQRWGRVDIKSTGLLANVLAKQDARAAGSFEAWFTGPDGTVREGGSTNAYIVRGGTLITHPLSAHILPGIARQSLLSLARGAQIPVEERAFHLDEALGADEALLTSTTAPILPVVRIDGLAVGSGRPGPITARLVELVHAEIARQTGWRA